MVVLQTLRSALLKPYQPWAMPFRGLATAAAKKTALYDFHVEKGGKLVDFAGWEMPVNYSDLGQLASHHWTREKASLFDVGHMLQTRWVGADRVKFLEKLIVADLEALPVGSSTLTVLTNENGGIIDDAVINKQDEDGFYMVSNAGCADKDLAHLRKHLAAFKAQGGDVDFTILDKSLIALQGPAAAPVLEKLVGKSLEDFAFMSGRHLNISGIDAYVSRCGYTGEDGFEISVAHEDAVKLSTLFVDQPDVKLAGLGARDSLRLEAGLCLYGHDIDDTTTPVEAGLSWTIGKRRKEQGGFLGSEHILPQLKKGAPITRRRIGLLVQGAPAREHAQILASDGQVIGAVTSGCPSPVLKKNVAMGYVKGGFHKQGTELTVVVRNKPQKAVVVKMPFVEQKYYRGAK
ncbi:hypothetical protein BC829DRAFT_395941 [Chytridium lagenaria]|nr:hypothetical protein BC829DRAFT_395941 [Chytridium lagenaria]